MYCRIVLVHWSIQPFNASTHTTYIFFNNLLHNGRTHMLITDAAMLDRRPAFSSPCSSFWRFWLARLCMTAMTGFVFDRFFLMMLIIATSQASSS
jgi:hypothetical protein